MTIKELARMAGVSVATVSRVLNGQKGVKDEVRLRVKKLIEKTGYKPNLIARALISKKTNVIGIVVPFIDTYYTERINVSTDILNEYDYGAMIANSMLDHNKELKNLKMLQEKQVEGIIFFGSALQSELQAKVIAEINRTIPVIVIDMEIEGISAVLQDDYQGAYRAVQYLTTRGCRNIGFVGGLETHRSTNERYRGFCQALSEADLTVNEKWVRHGDFSTESGYNEMKSLLEEAYPDAVFVINDNMTLGAYRAIYEKGLHIPQDISVISTDDMPYSKYMIPALTTSSQDQYETGKQAALMLLEKLQDNRSERRVALEQKLIVRESVR